MNKVIVFFSLMLTFYSFVNAQEDGTIFANGIVVAHKREISKEGKTSDLSETYYGYGTSSAKDNIIYQIYYSEKKKEFTGYDLEFSPQQETGKFVVKIKPLSLKSNKIRISGIENWTFRPLPKYSDEMIVDDGDTIFIDVLENPTTKEKVTDLIKITRKKREYGSYFPERRPLISAKDFTVEDIELRLTKYQVFVNDEKVAQIGGGSSGNLIWVSFPNGKNKGRFIFSIAPRNGYDFKKIGTITNGEIEFIFNGDKYKFTTETPIILSSGTWNLWVLYDSKYQSESKNFVTGATDKIEYLFNKNEKP